MMLHDPGRTLGAENASVHGMIPIPFNVTNIAVLEMKL